ncbi:kelch-like protein 4 isoform X1 [Diabrotica virgifera virgifera]|uniref:Kelch-like protein 4 isoform X1 n=1 Tax=Diabrotica virgifera virgifera TaxID=50390 RepID=A0A6P7G6B1_DIAVI|nr:kelch-like protein 4 isoform X1 [Diabrotica virgifera virgifera]
MDYQGDRDDSPEPSPSKSRRKGSYEFGTGDSSESCQKMVDNSENVLKVLKRLYFEKEMCDVYFVVGHKEYGAHRIILCASSDVFHVMLMRPEWSECHESRIELQEMSVCEPVFPMFLEYFYTGKIMITHTNVMPILALADKYMVKSLSRICISYMCKHVPHAVYHNQLFSWWQYATACGHNVVFETCQNYIKRNFEIVANTPDFCNFDINMFSHILEQNDIVVHNEIVLYNCAVRWLDLQRIKLYQHGLTSEEIETEFRLLTEKILTYIRFPMMSPRELADLVLSPVLKLHKEFYMDRMSISMNYHSGYTELIKQYFNTDEGKRLFTPRLYTCDSCSALLTIDNFNSIPNYHTSTFVFSSCLSTAEHQSGNINEWLVDLYPKGVWFKKCFLIVWQGTLEVPEEILTTVRLSLTSRELSESTSRVKISVLIYGMQGGVEHVMEVKEVIHHFSDQERTVNIDNLIPFYELNKQAASQDQSEPVYLVGPNRDSLKLNLVIAPVT